MASAEMGGSDVVLDALSQVEYLRDVKNITFELVSEKDAIFYLEGCSYFYKTKAFAKNFDKYCSDENRKGRYVNLDFGHLVELEDLDNVFRRTCLDMALGVERALKVRINASAMRCSSDPVDLTRDFLVANKLAVFADIERGCVLEASEEAASDIGKILLEADLADAESATRAFVEIQRVSIELLQGRDPDYIPRSMARMAGSNYTGGIVAKHGATDMPYWALMELISFGPLVGFYKKCFAKHGLIDDPSEAAVCRSLKNLLRQVQSVRNAAAHGDAMLNSLAGYRKSKSLSGVRRKLEEQGVGGDWLNRVASVPVAMEFSALLMCFDVLVNDPGRRCEVAHLLDKLVERFLQRKSWFEKCYAVNSFIDFVEETCAVFSERLVTDRVLMPL